VDVSKSVVDGWAKTETDSTGAGERERRRAMPRMSCLAVALVVIMYSCQRPNDRDDTRPSVSGVCTFSY